MPIVKTVIFGTIPVFLLTIGVWLCIRRLSAVEMRLHWSLLDCLAAVICFIPVVGVAAVFDEISDWSLQDVLMGVASLITIVAFQVLGFVVGRTSALVCNKDGWESFCWILWGGLLALVPYCIYMMTWGGFRILMSM